MSVYQRKDGKWVGSIDRGKDEFGKRKRKVVYGNSKKEVETKINTLLFEIRTGEYEEPNKDTLISFLQEYHKICGAKWEVTTSSLYKMYIDVHFEPYFKDMKLIDVKPITLDKFYNFKMSTQRSYETKIGNKTIKKTVEPLSINSVIKLNKFLKAAFNYALKNKLVKSNPTNHVVLAKKEKFIPNVYDENKFMLLMDDVRGTDDEIPIILGAGCGLRRGEIFGLYWRNINLDNKTISIEQTEVRFDKYCEKDPKTDTSKRTIVSPEYVINVLSKYKGNSGSNDKVITRWKPGAYSARFSKLLKDFGLPHIRLHDLRHYNAITMMNKGIPDKVAAERLGHSEVSTLREVYQHVLKDMDTTAANEINDMFVKKEK